MTNLTLHDGTPLPALGLGTWKSGPGQIGAAVTEAIRLGYRHLDCAAIYGNEAEIGAALASCFAAGYVRREELWITSKLWNDRHAPDDVVPALEQTLADLRLDSLDLYLIHWPVAQRRGKVLPESADDLIALDELPIAATWQGLERAVDAGLTRHVGVSNFSLPKLVALCSTARIRPAMNQVELHPYLQQQALVDWCQEHGVGVTAYSPLGSPDRPEDMKRTGEPRLLDDPVVAQVAERRGATPGQVLIAWALHRDTLVIPKSVHPARLAENLAAGRLSLDDRDLRALGALERNHRYVLGDFWEFEGGPYTLANLWDE
ncbi:MAG: aldo/keto reductase [Planctomycetes bacterium]|nr:aldo/keto reductase [Planctomycetota bacterium]